MKCRKIRASAAKVPLKRQPSYISYWKQQSYAEQIGALEEIRREYNSWNYPKLNEDFREFIESRIWPILKSCPGTIRKMETAGIGIIGGSGLYRMPELENVREAAIDTPFGKPSDAFIIGELEGVKVAFLPRHGRSHRLLPTELPFRANIYAMKLLGVDYILSVSAVGSLQEKYAPTDMVIPDQFFDRTRARARESTFFGEGIVGHVTFSHPVCGELGDILEESCRAVGVNAHRGGTYLCMEGPAFSTKAESNVYRQWGMDVIGMTNLQEAKLAREAEIAYATLALVTDYDCWREGHDDVTAEMVIEYLNKNVRNAQLILKDAVKRVAAKNTPNQYRDAIKNAIFTAPELWPHETAKKLEAIIGKYQK